MARDKQEIIYFLANKYDLPLKEIEEIVNYQFKFVADVMKEGKFDKFTVNKDRLKYINEKTNKKNSEEI